MIANKLSLKNIGTNAKTVFHKMAIATSTQKNGALLEIVRLLKQRKEEVVRANREDIFFARTAGLGDDFLEQLSIYDKLDEVISRIETVAAQPDPIGQIFDEMTLANGVKVAKQRTSLGVVGVIYEQRPSVTLDVSALSIKSGNCTILRGGAETISTNLVFAKNYSGCPILR